MKNIYLGVALTNTPESFQNEIKDLIKSLKRLERGDFMVAICLYPSTGMGYEICHALSLGKKVYAFAKEGESVSKFLDNGIANPSYKFYRVKELKEIENIISKL